MDFFLRIESSLRSAKMSITADKVMARRVASKASPVVEGYEVSSESNALDIVESMGFPVILKAVEGGGRRGLRIVRSSQQLGRLRLF